MHQKRHFFQPQRQPDMELVGYLHRWSVLPRNRKKNQYLHYILSADEPVLHDHPWDFKSVILSGGYIEHTPEGEILRTAGDVFQKRAKDLHYISHVNPDTWTMVFTGPTVRDWGFLVEGDWISHTDYQGRQLKSIFRNGYSQS